MAGGLIATGSFYRQAANQMLGDAAKAEQRREMTNDQIKLAEKSQRLSMAGTGAGVGAMVGAQYGAGFGPWGAAIGAGVGLLGSMLF